MDEDLAGAGSLPSWWELDAPGWQFSRVFVGEAGCRLRPCFFQRPPAGMDHGKVMESMG
jgi:hypothetical protein